MVANSKTHYDIVRKTTYLLRNKYDGTTEHHTTFPFQINKNNIIKIILQNGCKIKNL